MISRVRARLRGGSVCGQSALDSPRQGPDDRTARLVWLLSAALLLPLLARGPAALPIAALGLLAYAFAALPALLPPPPRTRHLLNAAREVWVFLKPARRLARELLNPVDRLEQAYMRMANISIMVNQIVFFTLCDRLLLAENGRHAGLYSIMFYNVAAYCVSYIKELIQKEDWSPYVTLTERSNIKHLAMSATKIVLEWTKAVIFIITVVFMLLVFGLEQGLHHYRPTALYTALTGFYYVCTEKVFAENFTLLLTWLQLPALEALEPLWAPVILRAVTMALSAAAALALLCARASWRAPVAALYLNVWLRGRETHTGALKALNSERAAVAKFRFATADELAAYEDVCAVCLSSMKRARVTPCHHLFHGECLRQCLKASDHCPICKQLFKFY